MRRLSLRQIASLLGFGYLFFLAIELVGRGMKVSFKDALHDLVAGHGGGISELGSFFLGLLGTSLVQSSSTVTSMSVVLTQEGVIPLVVAVGIAHGANLGTTVTSTLVAFFTNVRRSSGRLWEDAKAMLFAPRTHGFKTAVGTAVVHDMFNIIMVTGILLAVELPFGAVREAASASAEVVAGALQSTSWLPGILQWVSPGTYTKPVSTLLLTFGAPGWLLALVGLPLLFASLKGFANRMKAAVLRGVDEEDVEEVGERLLGKTAWGTFGRGLLLTVLVQSSSATTSIVVPLAAMGFFPVRKILPFIFGANIGTCTTAVLAASSGLGEAGFHVGMTVALSHLYLNTLAVILVAAFPPLSTSILGSADWLSSRAASRPVVLLMYLALLCVVAPTLPMMLPVGVTGAILGLGVAAMVIGPHLVNRVPVDLEAAPAAFHQPG